MVEPADVLVRLQKLGQLFREVVRIGQQLLNVSWILYIQAQSDLTLKHTYILYNRLPIQLWIGVLLSNISPSNTHTYTSDNVYDYYTY